MAGSSVSRSESSGCAILKPLSLAFFKYYNKFKFISFLLLSNKGSLSSIVDLLLFISLNIKSFNDLINRLFSFTYFR
jgi:hypothetical protein